MSGVEVRHMTDLDVPRAADVSAAAFEFQFEDQTQRDRWHGRLRHCMDSDPDGSFVATRDGEVIGVAHAIIRDDVWILSLLTVDPNVHGGGAGRLLMDAALTYGADKPDGLIVASNDPRALRLYASLGFRLRPTFQAEGRVDAGRIPKRHREIVPVTGDELPELDPVSRAVRGAGHSQDLKLDRDRGSQVFRLGGRGWVAVDPLRGVRGLAALDEEAAQALLWHGLSECRDLEVLEVGWITGEQQWAIEVLLAARVPFKAYGAFGVRGEPGPLHPYIPSPPFA